MPRTYSDDEMDAPDFQDKELVCVESDCGKQFVWTAGEQRFMHQLMQEGKLQEVKEPRRCAACRKKKKMRQQVNQ